MQKWLQRIRGAIGVGLTWGAVWAVVGMVPRWVFGFNADAPFPLVFGVFGFVTGVTFSALLALTERRRTFDQLSLPRVAGWGAVGGLLVSSVFARLASFGWGDVLVIAPTFAAACVVSASATLALARRAARRELGDGRADDAKAELGAREYRKLR
jgi:hypothetical protein